MTRRRGTRSEQGAHDGAESSLAAHCASFFAPGGPLARTIERYEERPEQLEIARAVAHAVEREGKLLAEAGTGTGKTLAYLVPAALSGRRFVVSTATKNLQEQILHDDGPRLARALGRDLDLVLLKGRANYLCLARAARLFAQRSLPGLGDLELLPLVGAWAERTTSGDRAELAELPDGSPLWRELSATADQCTGRLCREVERCFVTQSRRRAQAAQIVVVNHHLYFADLGLRQRATDLGLALLPPHDLVVFDEAHELEEVSAQHFGCELSEWRVLELGRDLVRSFGADRELGPRLAKIAGALEDRCRRLFDALPYSEPRCALSAARLGPVAYERRDDLADALGRVAAEMDGVAHEEAPGFARRAATLASELRFVLPDERIDLCTSPAESQLAPEEVRLPGYVRFTEQHGRTRALLARPVEVAPMLHEALAMQPSVFISATLSVRRDFAHARARLGIDDAEEVLVDSPFDYAGQAALYIAEDLPEPDDAEFGGRAAARAAELASASGGGAFVLCTSHRMLSLMRAPLEATGLEVLVQGDAPKPHLLEAFKGHGDAVLCATMSFWQGVDVPGRALRLVVIDKLPFASPGDPLTAARLDHLRARGVDPFTSFQLPQAALLLRQGFGRLIRRRTDTGMVAILDRRIEARRYGRTLLASLPSCRRVTTRADALELLSRLRSA